MDYKIEYPEKNTAVLYVTVDKEAWQKDLKEAADVTKTDDAAANREYAVSAVAAKTLQEAVAAHNLKIATQPAIVADDNSDGSVSITLTLSLVPEVTLGAYTGFDLERAPIEVSEEEVMAEAAKTISAQKIWDKLPEDAPAKEGDQVIIDFVGEKDGVPFEGGSAADFPLVLGSGTFIPGFEDQLIGAKAGEKVEVNVSFPENYPVPDLAGQPVVFHVTVKAVEQEVKPELNDAFIEKMKLNGITTVDALLEKAKADMTALKEQEADNQLAVELLDKICDGSSVELPQAMIDNQVAQHMQQYEANLKQYGMSFADYLKATGQSEEDFRALLVPQAEQELKSALVLEAIAEKEQIQAADDEIQKEYDLLSTIYNMPAAQLRMLIPEGAVAYQITQRKTVDFLKDQNLKKEA